MSKEESLEAMSKFHTVLGCCHPCTRTRIFGVISRTLMVIFNILLWFGACAIISVGIWLLFVDHATKTYFTTFEILNITLYIVLVTGILLLIVAFIGTFGANLKNEILITLSVISLLIIIIAEIIGLILLAQNNRRIRLEAEDWYKQAFLSYPTSDEKKQIVEHVQHALKCCGINRPTDFATMLANATLSRKLCYSGSTKTDYRVLVQTYTEGCKQKIDEQVNWLLTNWPIWFGTAMLFILELGCVIAGSTYLVYLLQGGRYDYDDETENEESGLIDSDAMSTRGYEDYGKTLPFVGDLPHPKIYRIVRKAGDNNFGFRVMFDEIRNCHVVVYVEPESCADFAGLSEGSQIIEINGLMAHSANSEEIEYKLAMADKDIRILVIDAITSALYEDRNVSINLRNVEGITQGELEYKPRLCKVSKQNSGFGFSLLYLEDRKGEYIEELVPRGSGEKAGLKIGDRIVEVNGVNIEKEKSREVVDRIRMSGSVLYLLVVDPKTDGFFRKKAVTISASLDVNYFSGRAGQNISTPKAKRKTKRDVKPRYCRLAKKSAEEFGLYVVIDNDRIGQVVRWVDCGGAADRAGLRIGDRIVEVNGKNVEYEPHQRLIEAISRSRRGAHVIVVDEDYDRVYKRNKPRLCRMFKERDAFGFCVEYDRKKDGHYIEEVDPSGPAERAGLKVGDRVIQMNGVSVEQEAHEEMLLQLRGCENEVVLLVIDSKSSRHYKQLVEFKNTGMDEVDYDAISIPEQPVFVTKEDPESGYNSLRGPTLSIADSISMAETQSFTTFMSEKSVKPSITTGAPRQCTLRKTDEEEHGFFLAIDRDRNGQIIRRVVKGGPAELAGLMDGDRILCINGDRVEGVDHDEVVSRIRESGNVITFTVIDERSDQFGLQGRPFLFKVMKDRGGYGFYLWHDESGHFVQNVTISSPADKAGLRCGDRLIEINGVNVEDDTHEDVFYRIKACTNVVNILAVDAKTFFYCKKKGLDVCARKAESRFSGESNWKPVADAEKAATPKLKSPKKQVTHEVTLKKDKDEDGYGFHLAYSNSFMGEDDSAGGHVVHWVGKGGPADIAGIRDGDRIICVNEANVEEEDHEQVMVRIHANGQNTVKLLIEYEEDAQLPHDVEITKESGSFGFYLWFDENGHYMEDVTIGSTADRAGLKIRDRLIMVNGENVESKSHEDVVSMVRNSGEVVKLNVVSVKVEQAKEVAVPRTCEIVKKHGSYGFCIQEDSRGLYIEFVQASSAAEIAGLYMGDRLIEINGESVKMTSYNEAISKIMKSRSAVTLTVLSVKQNQSQPKRTTSNELKLNHDDNTSNQRSNINPIFHQLLGEEKIDYVVEKREYGKNKDNSRENQKSGTDLRAPVEENETQENKSVDLIKHTAKKSSNKSGNRKLKRSISNNKKKSKISSKKDTKPSLKTRYSKGEDNVAFVEEDKAMEDEETASEGHFLDFTLKKLQKTTTASRRPITQRPLPQNDLTSRFDVPRRKGVNQSKRNQNPVSAARRAPKFHLADSGTLRWKFEETDSRRPGQVMMRSYDPIKEKNEDDDDDKEEIKMEQTPSLPDEDKLMEEEKDLMMVTDEDFRVTEIKDISKVEEIKSAPSNDVSGQPNRPDASAADANVTNAAIKNQPPTDEIANKNDQTKVTVVSNDQKEAQEIIL
ncbi:uncharacterized protein LOC143470116 isoform X2 [Clavelina lepadiformis]|uniref:uncharacterized protein LOC143470116 isoform X2 n=1 Tax=Clavelina lepadiformis TaxID=159417 RepID=UPI004042F2D1